MVKDIILTDYDLTFKNGDLKVAESDAQHVEYILKAHKGHFYQWPLLGVGMETYIGASLNIQSIKREVRNQLESDNYNVTDIIINTELEEMEITVDAERIKI